MKHRLCLAPLLLLLLLTSSAASYAQETRPAQQSVEAMRSQLSDIEAKQATIEGRMRQLDEDLRPENIERSLSLTGSTRPEELREKRRQQLEKEKASLQSQLDQLATSKTRLQAAITTAETAIYQQSAGTGTTATTSPGSQAVGTAAAAPAQTTTSAQPQPRPARRRARRARTKRRPQ
jgi:peptidoglycan hydrolase CwlO-like protein